MQQSASKYLIQGARCPGFQTYDVNRRSFKVEHDLSESETARDTEAEADAEHLTRANARAHETRIRLDE